MDEQHLSKKNIPEIEQDILEIDTDITKKNAKSKFYFCSCRKRWN